MRRKEIKEGNFSKLRGVKGVPDSMPRRMNSYGNHEFQHHQCDLSPALG